jgi:NAD(P)-dependent dehydrogenase (short-subunit alcohol dehydrogenase family)
MLLTNKVSLITGSGGGGSGRAIACRFAREGSSVIVCDIDESGGQETVRLIEAEGGRAVFFRADVGVDSEVHDLMAFADEKYGGVDVLVNNASDTSHLAGFFEHWNELIRVDLLAPVHLTFHAIEAMRRRGGGAIVNIGSTSAVGHGRKHSRWPAYDVAKAGVMRLTTTLAPLREELGIRVNCLIPNWVASPPVKAYWDSLTPQHRTAGGVPEVLTTLDEIADAVVRLATDDQLAGRLMIFWNSGEPPRFIPWGDPGCAGLE